MQELKLLGIESENKVLLLAKKYQQLNEELVIFKQKNKELKEIITKLEVKIKEQASQLVKYKLGGRVNNNEKYTDVKLKVNELVREIDVCMSLLKE